MHLNNKYPSILICLPMKKMFICILFHMSCDLECIISISYTIKLGMFFISFVIHLVRYLYILCNIRNTYVKMHDQTVLVKELDMEPKLFEVKYCFISAFPDGLKCYVLSIKHYG